MTYYLFLRNQIELFFFIYFLFHQVRRLLLSLVFASPPTSDVMRLRVCERVHAYFDGDAWRGVWIISKIVFFYCNVVVSGKRD